MHDTYPLTLRKINSLRSVISCKNCGATHLEEAVVLTLTVEFDGESLSSLLPLTNLFTPFSTGCFFEEFENLKGTKAVEIYFISL